MITKKELNKKRARLKRKKKILKICKIVCVIGICVGLSQTFDLSWLDDSPKEYSIPDNAISGGEFVGEDGITYERYQLGDKFYILSKSSGARIPQN